MWPRCMAVSLAGLICASFPAAAAPSCFPPVEIPHAKIVRVERNGVLVLDDGRAARLEGILLPAGAADGAPEFFAEQAVAELGELATGHIAAFAAQPPKEDRYGRLRAQVLTSGAGTEDSWLQIGLLRRGLARVSIAPDRGECASELYAAEARARAVKAGIWSSAAYGVRTPQEAAEQTGKFQIVEGTVQSVANGGGRVFLDFGPDWRKDFAVTISADDLRNFRTIGVDPFSYANQTVRVRGWIARVRRPEMDIATPQDIEVIEAPDLRGWTDPAK
ncbi:MAG TPA: thermonuclease family protein [Rhizomicrobium sp.]|nr:thermonuclease family protein [Rhizomicrobium sp.]